MKTNNKYLNRKKKYIYDIYCFFYANTHSVARLVSLSFN